MKASLKYLRITPRKARLVADLVRGKNVEQALDLLKFTRKRSAKPIAALIKSAASNADQKGGVNVDKLFVKTLYVDEGPTIKRWMPRAQGRATPIMKRTSHVTVELEQRQA